MTKTFYKGFSAAQWAEILNEVLKPLIIEIRGQKSRGFRTVVFRAIWKRKQTMLKKCRDEQTN